MKIKLIKKNEKLQTFNSIFNINYFNSKTIVQKNFKLRRFKANNSNQV